MKTYFLIVSTWMLSIQILITDLTLFWKLTYLIWFWILFQVQAQKNLQLQEELMEVNTNDELKFNYKSCYRLFWLQKEIPTPNPEIWAAIHKFLIEFPSSYLLECGFSAVTNLLKKKKNPIANSQSLWFKITADENRAENY